MKIRRSRSSVRANVRRAAWFAAAVLVLSTVPKSHAQDTRSSRDTRAWRLWDEDWNVGRPPLVSWRDAGGDDFSGNVSSGPVTNDAGTNLVIDGPYTVPAGGDAWLSIYISNNSAGAVTQSAGTLSVTRQLVLGYNPGLNGTYTLSGGSLSVGEALFVGGQGSGTFTQTGGSVTIPGVAELIVGGGVSASTGTYNLSGASSTLTTSEVFVGSQGHGTFAMSGGTFKGTDFTIGGQGGTGVFNLSGGSLGTQNVVIGYADSSGTFTQTGGSVSVAQDVTVAGEAGGTGAYNLSGATSTLTTGNIVVGNAGSGTFTQTGGSVNVTGDQLVVGSGGTGAYNLSGGSVYSDEGAIVVGHNGSGTFNQTGGSVTTNVSDVILGEGTGATGTYNLSGANSILSIAALFVGSGGTGTFNLDGGTLITDQVGLFTGTGTFNFNGGTLKPATSGTYFFAGLTTANVRAGGAKIDTDGFDVTISQPLVHDTTPGAAAIDGGLTKSGAGTLTIGGNNTYTGATIISAGTLQIGNYGTTGTLGTNTGAITDNGVLAFNRSNNVTLANVVSGTGGLTKLSAGTLTLTGANTYTGATTISGGTLQIGNGGTTGTPGTGAITDNGTLVFNRSDAALNLGNAIGGSGGVIQAGAGTTTFSGSSANTYTGDTQVNGGTLVLAKGSAGAGNNFGSAMGGNLIVNSGGTARYGASSQVGDGKGITVNAGGTLDLNGFAESLTGVTVNGGSVTTGAGYLNVRGAFGADGSSTSSYAGNLHLEAATANAARDVSVASGGTFTISAVVGNGDNHLATQLNKTGAGTLTLTGTNTYTGATAISAGTLQIGNGGTTGTLGTNTGAITDNGTLVVNRSNAVTLPNAISGSGDLTKLGAGTLTLTGVNTYTGNTSVNAGTLAIPSGRVGVAGSMGTLNVNGNAAAVTLSGAASLSTAGASIINGSMTQTGGSFTTNGNQLGVGIHSGNTGTYNLSGAGSTLSTGDIIVGNDGAGGAFNQSGGSVTLGADRQFVLGVDTAASSTWNLSGGSLSTSIMFIGYNSRGDGGHGNGTFNQTGGSVSTNGSPIFLGGNTDATGTYNLSGANSTLSTGGLAVGFGGSGVFNLDGGTLTTGYVGFNGGTGTFNFNGGTLKPTASNTGFFQGLTTANVRAGGAVIDTAGFDVTINQTLVHDTTAGAAATDGGLTKLGAGTLTFSGSSANTYTGDTQVNAGTLILAKGPGGGDNNFGSAMGGNLIVNSGGTARYGADSQVRDDKSITVNTGGTLDLNGFAESLTNLSVNGGAITTGAGYLNVRGAFAADSSATSTYAGNLHLEAATANAAHDVSVASGGTFTISAVVGNGDNHLATQLNKTGAGTLVLDGNNTYTGGTTISAGTLFAANTSGSATGTGAVVINNGGTLAGSGTIGGPVTVASGGTLILGSLGSPARLTLNSNLTLNTGSAFSVEVGGTAAGQYSQLQIDGALSFGGNLDVKEVNGFTLAVGQTFVIVDNLSNTAQTSGAFANAPGGLYTDAMGNEFQVNYLANADGGAVANDILLTVVPEPSTWAMALAGMTLLGVVLSLRRSPDGRVTGRRPVTR